MGSSRRTFMKQAAGFTAVQADVPEGMDAAAYGAFLDEFGLRPAPGYFGGFFDKSDDLAKTIEAAKQHAAKQAQLGLTEVMIAQRLSPQRIARPAVGADFDADRLSLVIENLVTVAQIIRAEGIQPCLHPHVGSWIETESEIRTVLDAVDPAALSFGPDPGHLFWANADPVSLITDYRDRVRAAHLKDVHAAAREKSRFEVSDYRQATGKNHVWTELGRGDVDLVGVLKALPDAVDVIVRGIKAGLPLFESIKVVAADSPEPLRGEFLAIIETQAIGMPLGEACARLFDRMPLPEANFFGIVIAIQQKSGGNLSEALGNLSKVLRDRKKMAEKIQAMSMEAKASAGIIGSLPPIVMLLVYLSTPEYISLLWTHPTGQLMLVGCVIWMSLGIFVMKRMINFDF